jgi:hypothetical protein
MTMEEIRQSRMHFLVGFLAFEGQGLDGKPRKQN